MATGNAGNLRLCFFIDGFPSFGKEWLEASKVTDKVRPFVQHPTVPCVPDGPAGIGDNGCA